MKFSVPTGTYWALGLFTPDHGHSGEMRAVVLPQFSVPGNAKVHLSARAATGKVGFAVPRPVKLQLEELTIARTAHGTGFVFSFTNAKAGGSLWINPVAHAPTVGALRADTAAWLTSPGHLAVPYVYSLNRTDPPGLILRDQRDVVRPGDLATIQDNYFQDVKTASGDLCTGPAVPGLIRFETCFEPGTVRPGRQVQYFTASPASRWTESYFEDGFGPGGQADALRLLHGGSELTEEWNRYPLHPAPNVLRPGSHEINLPSAIRAGNTLFLQITPFSDNTFGHLGSGFITESAFTASGFAHYKVSGRYALYQNGVRIGGGNAVKAAGDMNELGVHARP